MQRYVETRRSIFFAVGIIIALIFGLNYAQDYGKFSSVEVKFADASESGLSIVPASCESTPHPGENCDPTNPDPEIPIGSCTIAASPTSISVGLSSTLMWNTAPAVVWSYTGSISPEPGSVGRSGSTVVQPSVTTTYVFQGAHSWLWISHPFTCSTTITVTPAPTCPDGTPVPPSGICGGENPTCPDGSPVPPSGICQPTSCNKTPYCDYSTQTQYDVNGSCNYIPAGSCATSCSKTAYCDASTNTHYNVNQSCQYVSAGYCQGCPAGTLWNATTGRCETVDCPAGYTRINGECRRTSCPSGYILVNGICEREELLCLPRYYCVGRDLYRRWPVPGGGGACTTSIQQANCRWGCGAGTCLTVPPAQVVTWRVSPLLVRAPGTAQVTWDVLYVESCTVTGDNGDTWTVTTGDHSQATRTTSALNRRTVYTLSCRGYDGTNINLSETVNMVPVFDEQ